MKEGRQSNRKKMFYIIIPALLLFAGMLTIHVKGLGSLPVKNEQGVYPIPSKKAKKPLGDKANPLLILEIVPDKSMGTLGYFIEGCEPIDFEKAYKDGYDVEGDLSELKYALDFQVKTIYKPDLEEGDELVDWPGAGVNQPFRWEYVPNDQMQFEGYYEKVEIGGNYNQILDETTKEYSYVPVSEGETGSYRWINMKNTGNVPTDHEADKVWMVRDCSSYYKSVIKVVNNKHVFLKNVMRVDDIDIDDFNVQLITITPDELEIEENLKLLEASDVIYMRDYWDMKGLIPIWEKYNKGNLVKGKYQDFKEADLPAKAALKLIERMAGENPAALLMNGSAVYLGGKYNLTGINNNFQKFYLMFKQIGAKNFINVFMDGGYVKLEDGELVYYDKLSGQKVYDWSYTTLVKNGLLPDGTPAMNPDVSAEGFQWVANGCFSHNADGTFVGEFIKEKYGNTKDFKEVFDWFESIGEKKSIVSPADIVYYLLHSREAAKEYREELNILEIQPNNNNFIYKDLNEDKDQAWASRYLAMVNSWFKGTAEDIHVTTMSTWEFIGSLDDLNSTYDMIFIGINKEDGIDLTDFRDSKLNNKIYQHIGDQTTSNANVRYSGNDITRKKLKELKGFMDGGKPVVLSAGFYEDTPENLRAKVSKTIDKASYIYDLADVYQEDGLGVNKEAEEEEYRTKYRDKIFYESEVVKDQANLMEVLSEETCKLEIAEFPTKYSYQANKDGAITIGTVQYNKNEEEVKYKFCIHGDGDKYHVRLYMDTNGDGRYAGSLNLPVTGDDFGEEIQNLIITNEDGNRVKQDALVTDEWYYISKSLSGIRQGIVPWKLEVFKNENTNARSSVIDYTAIRGRGTEKSTKIKALQVLLSKQYANADVSQNNFNMETNSRFNKYLSCVEEFDVDIECISNKTFTDRFNENNSMLDDYDMLILGFQDIASFTNNQAIKNKVFDFIDSGKSVIFCHDMIVDWEAASKFTGELRAITGQDRYGILSGANKDKKKDNTYIYDDIKNQLVNTNIIAASGVNKQIYNTDNANRIYLGDTKGSQDRNWSNDKISNNTAAKRAWDLNANTYEREYISLTNQGQLTNYPYKIPDTIKVAKTHTQYFQLDMEADNMAVWYCLSDEEDRSLDYVKDSKGNPLIKSVKYRDSGKNDGIYSSRRNDVRSSYYIYSKGNLIYTGLGHKGANSMSDEEIQLFVNTLISACRITPVVPKTVITNDNAAVDEYGKVYVNVIVDDKNLLNDSDCDITYRVKLDSMIYIMNPTYYIQYFGYYTNSTGQKVKVKLSEEYNPQNPAASENGTNLHTVRLTNSEVMDESTQNGIHLIDLKENDEFEISIPKSYIEEKNLQSVELVLKTIGKDQNHIDRVLTSSVKVVFNQCNLFNLD